MLDSLLVLPLLLSSAPAAPQEDLTSFREVVSMAREERPRFEAPQQRSDEDARLLARVEALSVAQFVVDQEESLRSVAALLAATTGLPIVVSDRAEEAVFDEGLVFAFALEHPLQAADVLDLVALGAGDSVGWSVRNGAIVYDERAYGEERVVFLHSLLDLQIDAERFVEGSSRWPGPLRPFETDDLATLVMECVAPESWEEQGVWIEVGNGLLSVAHAPEVHVQIEALLDRIRDFWIFPTNEGLTVPLGDAQERGPILERLAATRVDVSGKAGADEAIPIEAFAGFLTEVSGVNFVVHPQLRWELDPEDSSVRPSPGERSVLDLLRLVDATEAVTWEVVHGVVQFVPAWTATPELHLVMRDVRSITAPFRGTDGEPAVLDEDALVQTIYEALGPERFDDDPRLSVRVAWNGVLVVMHEPDGIEQLDRLLAHLREHARLKRRVLSALPDRSEER